ncbi:MAG: serine hydrolase domain-containing protein [Lapillicoccus sp.]
MSRRVMLQGAAATALAGGLAMGTSSGATAAPRGGPKPSPGDWAAFDAAVGSAFDQMQNVGGALAVVSADAVLHTATFGSRTLRGRKPVTTDTHFAVGSTTKAMTAALVAGYVDQGTLGWDQKVVDVWSGFRAPTEAITRGLRVRDLLGMASGLGEPATIQSELHFDSLTAPQLLQSVVNLPVVAPRVDQKWVYNNTVQTVGGYLPLLATGVAPGDLEAAYANAMQERVFGPSGMAAVRISSDPRGLVDDYAEGYGFDLRPRATMLPFAPIGAWAPAGAAWASVTEMAAWVRLQLRQGRSVTGRQVVSAANLTECWRPHVAAPLFYGAWNPDVLTSGYAMGWFSDEYTDGSRLVWHTGGFDGFTTYMAFLPQHDLGLVVLSNVNPGPTGSLWNLFVLDQLLSDRLGLNGAGRAATLASAAGSLATLAELGRQARAVDGKAIEPWLGHYEGGWSVVREGAELQLRIGPRVIPLSVMTDGTYVMAGGPNVGARIRLAREADGTPHIELPGVETVRRTTG